ncbi:MAG TPA: ATPase, T2SS/T4P/T4SS family [Armatimonadota bacterium]|jgi:excisionase family DNA binding protein
MNTAVKQGPETVTVSLDGDELLDLEAAAEQLCVSKTTLYRMLERGEVKGSKVGRQWRFRARDLDAYLARGPVAVALAAVPLAALESEIAAIAEKLHRAGEDMPSVVDDALDQWEVRVVQLLHGIIKLARVQRSSDVHLEVTKDGGELRGLLRFRIDGVLHEIHRLPVRVYEALVLRIRLMASGDPGNGGYLDASLHLPIGDTVEDARISVMSTFLGEAVTIRLHSASDISNVTLDQLDFHADDLLRVRAWLQQPSGLIFTAGPSGTGKTTLLYKMLGEIARPARKVVTIEDPIEYQLPGVMQVELNEKTRNFGSALRAFFRHDIDAVLVGELRDLDTINLTLQLAVNGRLVLSPVHINSAVETLLRVVEVFPVDQQDAIRTLLANHVLGVVSMRLVRKLCPTCKHAQPLSAEMQSRLNALGQRWGIQVAGDAVGYQAVGCTDCGHTGFRGRTGLYEVLEMTPEFRAAFLQGASREELRRHTTGMRTLASEGLRKALEGITTFAEVLPLAHCES